jgi:hypothetical protein
MEGKEDNFSADEMNVLIRGIKRLKKVRTIAEVKHITDAAIRKQIRNNPDRYQTFNIDGVLFIWE